MKKLAPLLALLASPLLAQVDGRPIVPRHGLVGSLPTCDANSDGFLWNVYDGNGVTDCSSGSGTDTVACMCNGSSWVALAKAGDVPDGTGSANQCAFWSDSDTLTSESSCVIESGAAANTLVVDSNGRVGIGLNNPSSELEIKATTPAIELDGTTGGAVWVIEAAGAGHLSLSKSGSGVQEAAVSANGIGAGTATPAYRLEAEDTSIDGNLFRLQDSDGTCDADPESGSVTWSCSSTQERKKNIRQPDLSAISSRVATIPLSTYETKETDETKHGPIAEVLRVTHPELVVERPEHEECEVDDLGVETCRTIPAELAVIAPSVWELVATIKALAERVAALEARPGPPSDPGR